MTSQRRALVLQQVESFNALVVHVTYSRIPSGFPAARSSCEPRFAAAALTDAASTETWEHVKEL